MLSIILLSYQSAQRIEKFFDTLNERMLEEKIEFECIIMMMHQLIHLMILPLK